MAILINDNYSIAYVNKALDARYLDVTTPWADCAAVIAGIPTYRNVGLTVNINNEEWWWKDGIADEDLIKKSSSGTSNLSGATNGLSLFSGNTYIGLGGELTQDTTICGNYSLNLGNIASGLISISAVTPTFHVTDAGTNSSISFSHDQDNPNFDVCLYAPNANSSADIVLNVDNTNGCFIASTAPNTTCCSSLTLNTTDADVAVYNIHSSNADMHYVKEACVASSKLLCESLINRGNSALNIKTIMNYDDRTYSFITDDSTILRVSGDTARYGSNVTLTNDCDLVHKWYVDNAAGSLGGSNGLTDDGNNITLGGTLTGNTCIDGDNNSLTFSGSSNYVFDNSAIGGGYINLLAESTVCLAGCNISASLGGATLDLFDENDDKQIQLHTGGDVRFCNLITKTTETNVVYINSSTGQLATGATSNVQAANNGLSVNGTNVTLGGNLTGDTTINGLGNHDMSFNNINNISLVSASGTTICGNDNILVRTPSFTLHDGVNNVMLITSNCNILTDVTNSEGFVYAANYCDVGKTNPRWIPDNAYVTGLTTGSVSTASNGLTLTSNDVALGGTLTETTDICLGTNSLNIRNSGATTCSIAEFNPTTINLCISNNNSPFQIGKITVDNTKTLICNGYAGCYSSLNMTNASMNIAFCGDNSSFTVTDSTTTQKGIEYAADYSTTFIEESLITKRYSDSGDTVTLSSANTYTDNCALITLNSGKTYTDNCAVTTLSTANTYTDNCALITLNSGKTYTDNCAVTTLSTANTYTDNCALITLNSGKTYTDNCALITLNSGKTYTDNCATTTLSSANTYTDEEIAKLTGTTSQSLTGATNGLTKLDQDVYLGGTLSELTTINVGTNNLIVSGATDMITDFSSTAVKIGDFDAIGNNYYYFGNASSNTYHSAGGNTSWIDAYNTGCLTIGGEKNNIVSNIDINSTANEGVCISTYLSGCAERSSIQVKTGSTIFGGITGFAGAEYADDYSGNYTCLSIPNVGWVTGQTSASGVHTASNGLCKIGTDVKLGGTLLENTTITDVNSCGHFELGVSGYLYAEFCDTNPGSTWIDAYAGNLRLGTSSGASAQDGAILSLQNDSQSYLQLTAGMDVCLYNNSTFKYAADYSGDFVDRSIVDKGYVDNQSNVVKVCTINTAYVTLRNDDLIGVDGLSTNQICLYATPVLGQRLTVVDICGNALADPITINGNGNTINSDACSTINTDYGSVTYIYNGAFWSAVAFIN